MPAATAKLPDSAITTVSPAPGLSGSDLLDRILGERDDLSAVERFSQFHDGHDGDPLQARYYADLLPASPPGPGRQYAFEVDLDKCSGCKACVTACHSLNGLDDGESWRDVGLLVGGVAELPAMQHVTTACHHCVDPGCLNGCPTDAYEKDPETGIVRHLDDQCFGCQYCTLACPYDVPKYNASMGIVRKCDMCTGRLAAGEAPACVQACPNEAIAITTVDQDEMRARRDVEEFLPAAPRPDYTHPTTVYKTTRPEVAGSLAADRERLVPEHAHWPLVLMLSLTQLGVGGFVALLIDAVAGGPLSRGLGGAVLSNLALAVSLVGLTSALFHLGRPHMFFRAAIGWRHSWLSREAIVFGGFAAPAHALVGLLTTEQMLPFIPSVLMPGFVAEQVTFLAGSQLVIVGLAAATVAGGLAGVFCSGMIYHVVRRPFWWGTATFGKFFGSVAVGAGALPIAAAAGASVASTFAGLPPVHADLGGWWTLLLAASA
ncbi:MAG: 4Fe-4S dicluster domain-containing protein, partial [Planctomycetota bacterium]